MLSQDVDDYEAINKTNGIEAKVTAGTLLFALCTQVLSSLIYLAYLKQTDVSTCGGIHSIGSDFTRTKERSGMQPNGSVLSEQTISKAGNTPISNKVQVE